MPDSTPLLPDISIRQLEYLLAIDRHDTWATAAASVGVSPSALSQGLAELERRVGVEMFESVGRRRFLRDAAQPVLDHARHVVALTDDLMHWSSQIRRGERGRVRLGLIDIAAIVHFPELLRSFRADNPDVDFTLTVAPSAALLADVSAGVLDLAVCVEPPDAIAEIETSPVLEEPLVVYAPPGTKVKSPATWGPWVLFPESSHTRTAVTDRLVELGATIDVAAESHQPEVLREMVRLGLGWTVLPRLDDTELGGIVTGSEVLQRQLVVARRTSSVTDPAVDELAQRVAAIGSQRS